MAFEFFKHWKPSLHSSALVTKANQIINDYREQGYTLTLRQLYYQFVARDLIENSERSYKNLGNIISKARDAGLIDWSAIEDRNRSFNTFWTDEDSLNVIEDTPRQIRFDQWARQDTYVEVWVEKEALGNVISRACDQFLVPHMSCKGYLSSSEAYRAGKRFERAHMEGKDLVLIHLGDHDPSGIDMTRDNDERLELYSCFSDVDVRRIALNMNQVEQYTPPPNPAKITDSRAKDYIKKFGRTSWELDALEPQVIEDLITKEIKGLINFDTWHEVEELEYEEKEKLRRLSRNWDDVQKFLDDWCRGE